MPARSPASPCFRDRIGAFAGTTAILGVVPEAHSSTIGPGKPVTRWRNRRVPAVRGWRG